VSRSSVVWQRFAAIVAAMLVVAVALAVGVVAISGPAELGEIGRANLFAAALQLGLMGTFFGALALAVGASTGRRSFVCATVAVIGVAGSSGTTSARRSRPGLAG
jgi:beta-exotoxin I transport system permease protein